MRRDATGRDILEPGFDLLSDVERVEDVFPGGLIGQQVCLLNQQAQGKLQLSACLEGSCIFVLLSPMVRLIAIRCSWI